MAAEKNITPAVGFQYGAHAKWNAVFYWMATCFNQEPRRHTHRKKSQSHSVKPNLEEQLGVFCEWESLCLNRKHKVQKNIWKNADVKKSLG